MKNKGFTLIELLAVIVILAIIAVIAIPKILNVVDESKQGAAKSSALGYIDAVEKHIMLSDIKTDMPQIPDGKHTVTELRTTYNVTIKGKYPKKGKVVITNRKVVSYDLFFDDYEIKMSNGSVTTKKVTNEDPKKIEPTANDTHLGIVFLDPTDLDNTCGSSDAAANVVNGTPTLVKTGCMKWYIFKQTNDKYYMILDHNVSEIVRWADIAGVFEDLVDESGWKVAPRSITAFEVADIIGYENYTSTTGTVFLDTKTDQRKTFNSGEYSDYYWLYDNLYNCVANGCKVQDNNTYNASFANEMRNMEGYYTGTWYGYPSTSSGWADLKYGVHGESAIYRKWGFDELPNTVLREGVRPVIEVSKEIVDEETD